MFTTFININTKIAKYNIITAINIDDIITSIINITILMFTNINTLYIPINRLEYILILNTNLGLKIITIINRSLFLVETLTQISSAFDLFLEIDDLDHPGQIQVQLNRFDENLQNSDNESHQASQLFQKCYIGEQLPLSDSHLIRKIEISAG